MASKVLPQSLISIPGTASPCPSNKLGFTNFFPTRFSSSNSNRKITISRVSLTGFGSPIISQRNKQLFVVRAEPNSEEGAATTPTDDDNAGEVESKAEVAEGETVAVTAEEKPPRKPRIKMGDIMGILNQRAIEATDKIRPIPDLRTGDIVELKLEVAKNRRRAAIYKGIVISKQNAGIHTTIRVRRIIAGIGVEIVFPVYSPNVKEIKVVKHRKVRRARLYYLRDKLPRFSTFK